VPATSGSEANDMKREAEAYNNSIYLMVGMPYLLLAGVGCLVYRGLRRKARMEQMAARPPDEQPPAAPPPGDA
jgi:hypothetical protein